MYFPLNFDSSKVGNIAFRYLANTTLFQGNTMSLQLQASTNNSVINASMNKNTMSEVLSSLALMELGQIDLVWKRSKQDKQTYVLNNDWYACSVGKVWKSGSQWSTLSGKSFNLLKDAKAEENRRFKEGMVLVLTQLNDCFNKNLANEKFKLSMIHKACLEKVLDQLIVSQVKSLMVGKVGVKIRNKENRFGNALHAFDYKDDMISFMKCGINYTSLKGVTGWEAIIKPNNIKFEVSNTKDIEQEVLTKDRSFGDNGSVEISIQSLDSNDITLAINSIFETIFNHLDQ
jgi:hypothetical protein